MLSILLIPFMLLLSYQDIKTREIRDEIVYGLFWAGVALNVGKGLHLAESLLWTLITGLVLYIGGIFALGDLWTGLIIAAWAPAKLWGVPLAVIATLFGIFLGAMYGVLLLLKKGFRVWLRGAIESFLLTLPFALHPLAGLAYILLRKVVGIPSPTSIIFAPFVIAMKGNLLFPVAALLLYTLLWAMRNAGYVFTEEKEPEEGDIPAEIVDEEGERHSLTLSNILRVKTGEIKPVHSLGADGLTEEDVERLKSLGIERIKVRASLPLVPFLTSGYVLSLGVSLWIGGSLP